MGTEDGLDLVRASTFTLDEVGLVPGFEQTSDLNQGPRNL